MNPIAHIHTPFPTKFGVPRQSGIVEDIVGTIVFLPPYRDPNALRGLEQYSHLWLIWEFSETSRAEWSPTVRPPRLGGNQRIGVWATRSPFRPNPIGLSSVRLRSIQLDTPQGPVIEVEGPDLMDGTPILDIKPYLPYTDSHPNALAGFAQQPNDPSEHLIVDLPDTLARQLSSEEVQTLRAVLAADPRPRYHHDASRIYVMPFGPHQVHFTVDRGILSVVGID